MGVALIALAATHVLNGGMAVAAYVLGAIALVTGVIRYCLAWSIVGINTCSVKSGTGK